MYNPAAKGSRLGEAPDNLGDTLPAGIEGLHFHTLCESSSYDLEKVLAAFEKHFGRFFPQLKWVNFGGGHLMTRQGYDIGHLIGLLQAFREKYGLEVILEPGSAIAWETGPRADAHFAAWCQGRTGYPIVDAAMRQLSAAGWMPVIHCWISTSGLACRKGGKNSTAASAEASSGTFIG